MTTSIAAILECTVLRWMTWFPEPGTRETLRTWAESAESDVRRVEEVHDVVSVLWQRTTAAPDLAELERSAKKQAEMKLSVPGRLLGETVVIVLKSDNPYELDEQSIATFWPGPVGPISAGEWVEGVTVYTGLTADRLVIVTDQDPETDHRLGGMLYGPFALAEAMRHKIQGQFHEYETRYQDDLKSSAGRLSARLQQLNDDLEAPLPDSHREVARSLAISADVFRAYSQSIRVVAPVRQLQAMLIANQHNLETAASHAVGSSTAANWLQRRYGLVEQYRVQVAADLDLIQPLLDSGEWLGHVQQGRMLATLGVNESAENDQRGRQQRIDQFRNLLLTAIGIWIGLGGIWATAVSSLTTKFGIVGFWETLAWYFSFPVFGLGLILGVAWLKRPTN